MKSISPLRYPGGKTVLYPFIKEVIICNNLHSYTYVECFAGGAGLAIALLLNDDVNEVVINDLDFCIYAFWYSVVNDTERFVRLIADTSITIQERLKQKNVYNHTSDHTLLEVGFATLFLNRTNRSGILTGGVMGGNDQTGKYKMDCRFNKKELIHRIYQIANKREKILLFNMDASELLMTQKKILDKQCFFFLDPPYVVKGGDLYKKSFSQNEHIHLQMVVDTYLSNRIWLMTYDNVPLIAELYNNYHTKSFYLKYVANNKKQGSELMIFSNSIIIPNKAINNAC